MRACCCTLGGALAIGVSASGSSHKNSNSIANGDAGSGPSHALSLSISDSGNTSSYSGPTAVAGGTVQLSLRNAASGLRSAQLMRVLPPHTTTEALKILSGNSRKVPNWIRAEGGIGPIAPEVDAKAVVNLPPGKYVVTDVGGPFPGGPHMNITVTQGTPGSLPSTPATITAATVGKDRYKWHISGALKAGQNTVTFHSKGANALHMIAAARITGNPSKARLLKALGSKGAFVDQQSFTATAVIDGGKSEVTPLNFTEAGRYVLFCPLADRDGGQPQFAEGLLTTVAVK